KAARCRFYLKPNNGNFHVFPFHMPLFYIASVGALFWGKNTHAKALTKNSRSQISHLKSLK
ncbi:MAG TPA: hypothetical protein VMZ06_09830, partial [Candidatus Bathyarchaeia archaeon]|nr:hypothetical protein [Candidatus Bathyarchaeia archaeon]